MNGWRDISGNLTAIKLRGIEMVDLLFYGFATKPSP